MARSDILTVADLVKLEGKHEATILRHLREGRYFGAYKIGRSWAISRRAYLESLHKRQHEVREAVHELAAQLDREAQ